MKQVFLKDSYDLGWGSSDYRVGLGGQGETAFQTIASSGRVVVPIDGIFSNLQVYSPAGTHPNYTVTMFVNNVASTLSCVLASSESLADDRTHAVSVVAGDDIRFSVNVNPFGSGVGYRMNLSIEFEGAQQFYSVTTIGGSQGVGALVGGGALGNGIIQIFGSFTQTSNSYSICSTPGILTGLMMKSFIGDQGVGNGWVGYLIKNAVLQDGTGGTVSTACSLTGAATQATSSFSLPIVLGDRLDFVIQRVGSSIPFTQETIVISCSFNPTDAMSFMCTGGSNNANSNDVEYRWMQSKQLDLSHDIVKCPIGPRGITVTGLRVEVDVQNVVGGVVFVITKNGIDTTATCTVPALGTSASIDGLSIPFSDGDFIALKSTVVNPAVGFAGNGCFWGLSTQSYRDRSGLYTPTGTHDKYYGDVDKKIPAPTIRTALIGE